MALCPNVSRASGETATRRACLRSRSALTSRLRCHALGKTGPAGALAPGLNTGPTRGKMPEGWTSSQGVRSDKCCRFNSASCRFEIIAHQRDRQVGGALHDANAQLAQGGAELRCALHVDRLNAHATFLEISLRDLRRQAEARPIGGRGAGGRARCRDDDSGGRAAASGLRGSCRTENPAPARERAARKLFPPSPIADASAQ